MTTKTFLPNEQLLSDAVEPLTPLVQECEVGTNGLIATASHYCRITSSSRTCALLSLLPADSLVLAVVENAEHLSWSEAIVSSIYAGVANCNHEAHHQSTEYLRSLFLAKTSNWRALVIQCAIHLFQLKKTLHANHQYEASTLTFLMATPIIHYNSLPYSLNDVKKPVSLTTLPSLIKSTS
jgi:hypothetical protein